MAEADDGTRDAVFDLAEALCAAERALASPGSQLPEDLLARATSIRAEIDVGFAEIGEILMNRRSLLTGTAAAALLASPAHSMFYFRGGGSGSGAVTIGSISLSSSTFVAGSDDFAAPVTVNSTGGTFSGTLSLSGTDAARFRLSNTTLPSDLLLNGTQAAGSYSVNIVATMAGAGGSPFTQPFTLTGTRSGAQQLYSLTVPDDVGVGKTAGAYYVWRGLQFKQGDMPAGTGPTIKVAGVSQPYSYGLVSHWGDGSIKNMSVICRPTVNLPARETVKLEVWNGGTLPAASARTLTEVYDQDIEVNGTGAGSQYGLAGAWGAWLQNDANNTEQRVYLDGSAGKVWMIVTQMAQTQGGAAHGQLLVRQYVALLNDASGNLGCCWWLGSIQQPKYDQNTPAKDWRAFSPGTVNWEHGGTDAATHDLLWPFTPCTWTRNAGANTQNVTTTTPHGYYSGSGDGVQGTPVILTSTGTLPTDATTGAPLAARLWFMRTQVTTATVTTSTSLALQHVSTVNAQSRLMSSLGSGTHTMTPVPAVFQFSALRFATEDGEGFLFQGTGSISNPSLVRARHDLQYLRKSKLIPPFDPSISAAVADVTWNYDFNAASVGSTSQYSGASGDQLGIGIFPRETAQHLHKQSAASERLLRINGLAGIVDSYAIRNSSGQLINLRAGSYAGMTAPSTGLRWNGGANTTGFTGPGPSSGTWPYAQSGDWSHKPQLDYVPFLLTGQPQFYDTLMERGNGAMMTWGPDRNPTNPYSETALITSNVTQLRSMGWSLRDLCLAAGICATTQPDGSALKTYFGDAAAANLKWLVDIIPEINSYAATHGLWTPFNNATGFNTSGAPWQRCFVMEAAMFGYTLLDDANAQSFLNSCSTWHNHIVDTFGGWHLICYYEVIAQNFSGQANTNQGPIIDSDDKFAILGHGGVMTWTAGTPGVASVATSHNWVLTNGDKFRFTSSPNLPNRPGGLAAETSYYAVNVSGSTCNLAASPGGAALPFTSSGSATPWMIASNPPATQAPSDGGVAAIGYGGMLRGMHTWMKYEGFADQDTIINDIAARHTANGTVLSSDPRWVMAAT